MLRRLLPFDPSPDAGCRRRCGIFVPGIVALVCAGLTGCAASPAAERSFPTLGEMAPAEPLRSPVPATASRGPALAVTMTRLVLPLEVSLAPAWGVVDEDVLPPLTRGVWRANGLRAGVLPAERLEAFLDGLPPVWSDRSFRIVRPDGPVLVRRSPPLLRSVFADLTVPPFATRREGLLGHRAAMLMDLAANPGGVEATFTPLHQKPTATVRPRSAAEKERSGRLFGELAVRLRIPRGSYGVIGLARDPGGLRTAAELAAEAVGPEPETDPNDTGGPPLPTRARIAPPPLPPNLGRALFTLPTERRGDPQVLLLVTPSAR